jgi:TatA/E family protein of Tat protein translocase
MDRFGDPMDGVLQPVHLVFILLIILILFGPGKLPELGKGLGRSISDLRGVPSSFRRDLFMAKGVDPSVGRDVGDMLPDEHLSRHETWYLCLLAILIGNTIYFLLSPILPAAARMDTGSISGLPVLVDLWICLLVFGFLNLLRLVRKKGPPSGMR